MTTRYPVFMPERDLVFFQLRLPADLHARLRALAEREDRSQHWVGLRAIRLGIEQMEADRPQQ